MHENSIIINQLEHFLLVLYSKRYKLSTEIFRLLQIFHVNTPICATKQQSVSESLESHIELRSKKKICIIQNAFLNNFSRFRLSTYSRLPSFSSIHMKLVFFFSPSHLLEAYVTCDLWMGKNYLLCHTLKKLYTLL